MKRTFWTTAALVAALFFAMAVGGCTVIGASLQASGTGITIDASVAGATTSATIGLPAIFTPAPETTETEEEPR